jgi:hypothetical protein
MMHDAFTMGSSLILHRAPCFVHYIIMLPTLCAKPLVLTMGSGQIPRINFLPALTRSFIFSSDDDST